MFTPYLRSLLSLNQDQAKQLIDIAKYLYDCRILHRDIRPDNLMIDDRMIIKLIDFGFATKYEGYKSLPVEGGISYAGMNFLLNYNSYSSWRSSTVHYPYERTFDLQCVVNIIMSFMNQDVKSAMKTIKLTQPINLKLTKLYQMWVSVKRNHPIYSQLLGSIIGSNNQPEFEVLKMQIEELLTC